MAHGQRAECRMNRYKAHPRALPDLDLLKREYLGDLCGYRVYAVDGACVRTALDIDFVAGGNPGRYSYVPEGEIWFEVVYGEEDRNPTILHEVLECRLMIEKGLTYSKAHDLACVHELRMRQGLPVAFSHLQERIRYAFADCTQ